MRNIEYTRPITIDDACLLLAQHGEGARIIAGGVAMTILLRERLIEPNILVDIEGISSLRHISEDDGGLRLGALCTHREIEQSPLVREKFPFLSQAAEHIGCVQIRNAGTVGGSLCHADPASDLPPMLIAIGAEVNLHGPQGERRVILEDFFNDYYQTALNEGEILTEIHLPYLPVRSGVSYMKHAMREGDMAIVSAAAMTTLDKSKERCVEVRVVLGAAGPTPLRVGEAEKALRDKATGEEFINNAAKAAMEASQPLPDSSGSEEYKREMIGVMTRRSISGAFQAAS